jgi:uncharacterized membrane protein
VTKTEINVDDIVSSILRTGVIVSALIVAAGGIWYLAQHGAQLPAYARFASEPSDLLSPRETLREAEHFDSQAIIMAGLLVLIATPILRVAFLVFGFALEKDWTFVGVAALVLSVLLFSIGH